MKFKPAPGTVVIEPVIDKNDKLHLGALPDAKIRKGKVVAVGDDLLTNFGAVLEMNKYCKVGDFVYFLTYDGGYDVGNVGTTPYHFAKIEDLRSRVYGG